MRKLYENFYIFHFQKRIVSAKTICGNTVIKSNSIQFFEQSQLDICTYERYDIMKLVLYGTIGYQINGC